jgi:hypothetical protein
MARNLLYVVQDMLKLLWAIGNLAYQLLVFVRNITTALIQMRA